jgi:hypothetical protein
MAQHRSGIGQPPAEWSEWTNYLAAGLHGRHRWRLPLVFLGILWANGRRTVTTWLRSAGVSHDFQDYYYLIAALARKSSWEIAERLFELLCQTVLRTMPPHERLTAVIDDTPTSRYGPHVEGAGIHHNPTSGPDDHKFLYGHVWVVLSLAIRHPRWHTIGLPLLGLLYVKAKDIAKLPAQRSWQFQTKLELAARLLRWAKNLAERCGRGLDVVFDGAYAYRPLLKEIPPSARVFSRLRRDAALWSVPPPAAPGSRGALRKYGTKRVSLAKRAGAKRGWQEAECLVYGKQQPKLYKTFVATSRMVGGTIRVVLVKKADGDWEPFFCTDAQASAVEIIEKFSDRSSIEQVFHDVKEVWGSGQQQVRNLWCNIGVFNLNLWISTLVEMWAWSRPAALLRDRSDSPWDQRERRPSHADRRKALRLRMIENELVAAHRKHPMDRKIKNLVQTLTRLAA